MRSARRGRRAPRPRWRRSARTAPCRRRARPRAPARRHGKASRSGASKVRLPTATRSRRATGSVGALGVVQRVGDRHPHVGQPEVREHRAVAERDEAVDDRLRVHDARRSARRGAPNRWWASITSRPLFISVAESIVILPPIDHVGWLERLLDGHRFELGRGVRPRNGPPEAVIVRRSIVPGPFARSATISWWSAACSESTGMICAPVASASAVTSSPPTTSDSLLASARSIPSPSATTVGPSPAEPTIAFRTRSAPRLDDQLGEPVGPAEHLAVGPRAPRARAAASGRRARSGGPRVRGPARRACSHEPCAERPTSSSSWLRRDHVERLHADRAGRAEDRRCAAPSARDQDREPDVVAADGREQHRVEAVERAAVGAEDAPGVLDPGVALDVALEEVADRRGDRDADAEQRARRPSAATAGNRLANQTPTTAQTMPMTSPSTVLFGEIRGASGRRPNARPPR